MTVTVVEKGFFYPSKELTLSFLHSSAFLLVNLKKIFRARSGPGPRAGDNRFRAAGMGAGRLVDIAAGIIKLEV